MGRNALWRHCGGNPEDYPGLGNEHMAKNSDTHGLISLWLYRLAVSWRQHAYSKMFSLHGAHLSLITADVLEC